MFSKIFTLGLAALTFVSAAPATGFQSPMGISCNVHVQSVGASAASYSLDAGRYRILDVSTNSWLRGYTPDVPLYVSLTREFPGPFAEWDVKPAKEGAFTIRNVGLDSSVYVGNDKTILVGPKQDPVPFAIEAAGDDTFVVKSVNADLVWTLKTPGRVRSEVQLSPEQGKEAQRWKFIKLDDN
ncbi:hypothetical protein MVEN_00134500 [Mycena venus]|uniref:Ricin B lectin domain-containing protein n=1 Tax=Mycena venus TaxID=2733690 RepID=A0A8H7DBB3_9AGAR|nr:hypothetical protein MVEN_00134500 [Mycena venus]